MRLVEFAEGFDVYSAKVRVKHPSYSMSVDVAVFAKSATMARMILQAQYGMDAVISNISRIS
jgi:hypothetical protein